MTRIFMTGFIAGLVALLATLSWKKNRKTEAPVDAIEDAAYLISR